MMPGSLKQIAATAVALGAFACSAPARAALKTFDITWAADGAATGAHAAVTLDTSLIAVSSYSFPRIPMADVADLSLTVVGGPGGGVTYGKSAFTDMSFSTASRLDLTRELIGQPVTLHRIINGMDFAYQAPYGVVDDGRTGSFNVFALLDSTPHSVRPFAIASLVDASYTELLRVTSILPRVTAVPEPETSALLLAGLGLAGFAAWRRRRR